VNLNSKTPLVKPGFHARNRHAAGYDFRRLMRGQPDLARFVRPNPVGRHTIDFADPAAVLALNRALLEHDYGIRRWEIPPGYLCPPVPGRADYLHHVADLLADGAVVPRGRAVAVLDIGVGANCIYPIIGVCEYGWRFVGTDTDPVAIAGARRLVAANPKLAGLVECRLQRSPVAVFKGVVKPEETFALSLCNPPFHASRAEATAGTVRKLKNLHGAAKSRSPVLNFGGHDSELWCAGGELRFVRRMIAESAEQPGLCRWFTTLVSKRETLPAVYRALDAAHVAEVRTLEMAHGQKKSRIVAWRFAPLSADSRPRGR
jgi:23S rRNA (adenine1618-N6)-methyltransferase